MEMNEIIGQNIKQRRIAVGMSQTELAKKLGYSGKSMISLIEAGKRPLYAWQIAPLCAVLQCTVEDLIEKVDDERKELADFIDTLTPEQTTRAMNILRAAFGGELDETTKQNRDNL